jgi:hypothetical protein
VVKKKWGSNRRKWRLKGNIREICLEEVLEGWRVWSLESLEFGEFGGFGEEE